MQKGLRQPAGPFFAFPLPQYFHSHSVFTLETPMTSLDQVTAEQDQWIAQAMERDGSRLRNYIRKHVLDLEAAEDILQEVFCELVEAYRLVKPIEQVSAWLFRVAKNRIVDRFRGRKLESLIRRRIWRRRTMCLCRSKTCCLLRIADLRPPMHGGLAGRD